MISTMPFLRRFAPQPKPVEWGSASDAALALAARTQDKPGKGAFVEIVHRHQAAVCAVAYGITGRIALTEDIAQETFLYAWKHLQALREPARLKAWLVKIARSTALEAVKREGRTEALGDQVIEIASADSSPDTAAADAEDERLVWEALAELPENYRLPLALFYNEGQSIAAVAEALELSADAVKQRLSRGREALREMVAARMAIHAETKLEGVLRRVQPGPLLVVSIAAAIGLIAAPAAMAAGAFSAATAGAATGGTGASASTFSTAMTASSYLVAGLTMAAFIPLGWKARGPDTPAAAPAVAKPAPVMDPFTEFSGSALLKEWKRLHEVHGVDAAAMPGMYDEIAQEKDAFRRRALRSALIAEWAAVDPAAAFAFLQFDKKQGDQATMLMREWLARDPAAAAQHLAANAGKAPDLARQLLEEVAKAAPEEMVEVVRQLPASDRYWDREVQRAFASWAALKPEAARLAALGLPPANRAQALAGVAEGWAQSDGNGALEWAKTLTEGPERDEALRATLVGWAKNDPAGALDHLDAAPPGIKQSHFASDNGAQVLRAAAERDFSGTMGWLATNPGKIGREAWMGLTYEVQKRLTADPAATLAFLSSQPEGLRDGLKIALDSVMLNDGYAQKDAVWAWLKAQPKSAYIAELTGMMLRITTWKEPENAMQYLNGMEDNMEARRSMETKFRDMLREGQTMEQLDAMLAKLPEQWRSDILATAFTGRVSDWLTDDLTPWIERIGQLPEKNRRRATSAIAGQMVASDPQAAVQWARSLDDAGQKAAAITGLTEHWAKSDSFEASEWVASLPKGQERDTAAVALAGSIAQNDPEAAWTWAASIGDLQQRLDALSMTFAVIRQDPQRARQLVNTGNLPADARAAFLKELDKAPARLVPPVSR